MENSHSILQIIWQTILNPARFLNFKQSSNLQPFSIKLWQVLQLVSFTFFTAFLISLFTYSILAVVGIDIKDYQILSGILVKYEPLEIFLLVAILAPILEEFQFRLLLTNQTWIFVAGLLILTLFGIPITLSILESFNLSLPNSNLFNLISLFAFLGIFFVLIFLIFQRSTISFGKNNQGFNYLFYGVNILFALSHLANFQNLNQIWVFSVFLVLPQLWGGFLMGGVRLRLGFWYAVLFHMFYNALAVLPVIFVSSFFNKDQAEKFILDINQGNFTNFFEQVFRQSSFIIFVALGSVLAVYIFNTGLLIKMILNISKRSKEFK